LQSAPNHGFELIHTFLFLFLNGLPAIPNVSFADDTNISLQICETTLPQT
jgi:hypothetical protein